MSNATTGSDRVIPDEQPPQEERGPRLARLTRPAVTHWQFTIVLAAAVVIRIIVILGYPPILWFNDSYTYVYDAVTVYCFRQAAHLYSFRVFALSGYGRRSLSPQWGQTGPFGQRIDSR